MVCYGIKKQRGRCLFQIADPASSLLVYSEAEIKRYWLSAESDSRELGIVLALEREHVSLKKMMSLKLGKDIS